MVGLLYVSFLPLRTLTFCIIFSVIWGPCELPPSYRILCVYTQFFPLSSSAARWHYHLCTYLNDKCKAGGISGGADSVQTTVSFPRCHCFPKQQANHREPNRRGPNTMRGWWGGAQRGEKQRKQHLQKDALSQAPISRVPAVPSLNVLTLT